MRSERRAENPGIRKEEDELRLDCWIQIRSTGWVERKLSSSVFLARRPPAFHWRILRESGAEEAGGTEGQPGARDGGGWQREKIQNGQMGDMRFGDKGVASVQHQQRGARLYRGGMRVGGVLGGSHSVTKGGAAPRVRAAKSSEFEEVKL